MINEITIATVNFNTPEYIFALARSIAKYNPNYTNPLLVIDNGNINRLPPVTCKVDNVCGLSIHHVDNTIYNELNEMPISKYPAAGQYNSARHAKTIEYLLDKITTRYVLLVDSDVVIIQDIEPIVANFIKRGAALMGYKRTTYTHPCIAPWACLIDLQQIKNNNIHFYDANRMLYVNDLVDYDTGASFYEDIVNAGLKIVETPDNTYYRHFKGGSVFKENGLNWLLSNARVWF